MKGFYIYQEERWMTSAMMPGDFGNNRLWVSGDRSVPILDGPVPLYKAIRAGVSTSSMASFSGLPDCVQDMLEKWNMVECNWRVERLKTNKCKNTNSVFNTKNNSSGRSGPSRTLLRVLWIKSKLRENFFMNKSCSSFEVRVISK